MCQQVWTVTKLLTGATNQLLSARCRVCPEPAARDVLCGLSQPPKSYLGNELRQFPCGPARATAGSRTRARP